MRKLTAKQYAILKALADKDDIVRAQGFGLNPQDFGEGSKNDGAKARSLERMGFVSMERVADCHFRYRITSSGIQLIRYIEAGRPWMVLCSPAYEDQSNWFESMVLPHTEPDTNGGCILWTGKLCDGGYGKIVRRGKTYAAHRIAFGLDRAKGMFVLHSCDVRACVNPAHLFLGTHEDNMADMVAKGRASRSIRPLSDAEKDIICERMSDGVSSKSIARELGRDRSLVRGWMTVLGNPPAAPHQGDLTPC